MEVLTKPFNPKHSNAQIAYKAIGNEYRRSSTTDSCATFKLLVHVRRGTLNSCGIFISQYVAQKYPSRTLSVAYVTELQMRPLATNESTVVTI